MKMAQGATMNNRRMMKTLIYGFLLVGLVNGVMSKRFSRHQRTRAEEPTKMDDVQNENVLFDSESSVKSNTKPGSNNNNVCQGWWCGHGKECQNGKNGLPECICQKHCPSLGVGKKKVCGSDGKLYPSHCELHRTACLTNTLLYIDHSGLCFENENNESSSEEDDDDDDNDDDFDDDINVDGLDGKNKDNKDNKKEATTFENKNNKNNYYDMSKNINKKTKASMSSTNSKKVEQQHFYNNDNDWKILDNNNDAPVALPLVKEGGGKSDGIQVENWPKLDTFSSELDYKVKAQPAETKKSSFSSSQVSEQNKNDGGGWGPLPKAKLGLSSLDFVDSLEADLDNDDDDEDDEDEDGEDDDDDMDDKGREEIENGAGAGKDDDNVDNDDFDMDTSNIKHKSHSSSSAIKADRRKYDDDLSLSKEIEGDKKIRKKSKQQQQQMKKKTKTKTSGGSSSNAKKYVEKEIRRDSSSSLCSPQEYEILKDNLLLYSHEKMIGGVQHFKKVLESGNNHNNGNVGGNKRDDKQMKQHQGQQQHKHSENIYKYNNEAFGDGPEAGKDYLLSLMFSHFDQNNNAYLEADELDKIGQEQNLGKLAPGCNLVDLLRFDDEDRDRRLSINEFYTAFNKLYSVSVISLDKAVEVTHVIVNVGDNVELKCDVNGSPPTPIVWKRYGIDLATLNQEDQVRVFSDGTLFLSKIQLLYAGNYTCQAARNDKVVQTHMLTVQTLPDVKVTPHIVWEKPGHQVTLECRVTGEPIPVVRWLKNDDPLTPESDKYVITGDSIRLTLKDIYFASTGAYICEAENSAGKRLDIASLVVIDDETPSTGQTNESQFFVFHDLGISVYNPDNCRIQHQISSTDIIPGTQEYVCGEHGQVCEWGSAIPISSTYVYVSQPKLDRILVISISQMVVVDVISTDRYPVELNYIPHLDQVWVRCWRKEEIGSQKTLQVIRDAKEKKKHHTVHPEPIDSHFDLVENIFLPPDLKSSSQFHYAYVSHKNARGLYKMDLIGIRYTKSIDLTPYNCFPQHVEFSALYGLIIVECFEPVTKRPTGQLVLDALTDAIVYYKGDRFGRPYLSPDSRKLITITHSSDGTTLMLQFVKENGLEFVFDVKTSLNISDISFFPSQRLHTYDLYASCEDKDEVLFLNLESGKVEMVSGVGGALHSNNIWKNAQRPISSQGLFSNYLVTPSSDAVFILNGRSHTVNCQIGGIPKPNLIVWL